MKKYFRNKENISDSHYVSNISIDLDTSSVHFQDNTKKNYDSLRGIFKTLLCINTEGQTLFNTI